ncbi:sulfate adenylyltransferase subunit 1 [Roseivirga ehrenbergii]|uniref:sulfate adenylyltransferase n=1 Tax=Roseivirga ehrenbergii (strain DSM 102268 / JCM 13514 / KCTC 12282 / NCIMB 14502 / KMM 6017) TaxID=279360 RepID=A0A150WYM8_ROSEK|nr:GTP-binding protein [Roseivirga ehrenbergii]KYG71392.1 sulfate adenylyltransferase [Roseivirga ehrenbergii]TCK99560.1 sulfate adenylyltransferase subunit 1 [Roseivirga ehrenbergii]
MDISNKQVLRIATAGSVDDGKSTLIGRLLFDTKSVTSDKLLAIEESSRRKGLDYTDLSLLTDGLVAEREQGITIDVAHIYFATKTRKYIIADTPGHIEYTRNMVTGASNADVSLILIDARNGLVEQTRRHLYIAHLLRVPKVLVCVNKMDLVGYNQKRFESIVKEVNALVANASLTGFDISFLPISSLYGENIVDVSKEMPWYSGSSLIEILEATEVKAQQRELPSRFQIQHVIRPKTKNYHDYRGYAGKIASGVFKVGDKVTILPSGAVSEISAIQKYTTTLNEAVAGESVSVLLKDDVGASRGDMLVKEGGLNFGSEVISEICWMDSNPLIAGKTYKLQHGVSESRVKILGLNHKINTDSLLVESGISAFQLNDIGEVVLKSSKPVLADSYEQNRNNGAFILIDEFTNNTVGVGFVA